MRDRILAFLRIVLASVLATHLAAASDSDPFDDAALDQLRSANQRFVLCVWSPHMPLSIDAVKELMRAGHAVGVTVFPLLDARSDLAYARSAAIEAGLPRESLRTASSAELARIGVFQHAPTIVGFVNGQQTAAPRPGYLDAAGYESILRRWFGEPAQIVRPAPDEPPIDDVNWFARPVPHAGGHKVVAFASHNLNYLYDLTVGRRIRIPDRSDAVATPDGRYMTVPSHYTADHTVKFYDLSILLKRLEEGRDAADVPPVFSHDAPEVYDVYYQSVGVLEPARLNGGERTTYRMMFSGSRQPAPPGFRIVDYTFEDAGGHATVRATAPMRLCPEIVRDMATPFISKDGRFVIAHDDSNVNRAPSLKIFEITATDPAGQTTSCRQVVDFGFPAGKADFSYDGTRVTFHIATYDYLAAFIDGGLKPPVTTDVVVADLIRTDGRLTGYANLTRVTQTGAPGTGSYFPAFFPDGSLFYISSAVPKTADAPKRFTFTATTLRDGKAVPLNRDQANMREPGGSDPEIVNRRSVPAVTTVTFEERGSGGASSPEFDHDELESAMRADITPGAVFPDYELSDHRAVHRKLSELQGGDPLVLVLARGGFCPKDRRQHEGLLQLHREMQVGYCRLVTLSTDNLLETNEFRSAVGANWTFLSDPARKVQADLDIAEYTDPTHNPMIPHTVVLEPGLRIYRIYNGYWFFGRPTVEELRLDLRAVLQRCRPDWDISSAEQRAAWARGDKANFYPYGKTQVQVLAQPD